MAKRNFTYFATVLGAVVALTGCEDGAGFNPFKARDNAETSDGTPAARPRSTRLVERDVEAPEVFQVTENGLWDGRPSLGGVWVAHPDVADPERVIIRNEADGKFVIGALFRRERETPGPRLQVSSDAAEAMGMLAGQPANLNVTALRREEITPEPDPEMVDTIDAPGEIEETRLDPIAAAAAAIDGPTDTGSGTADTATATAAATPAPAATPSTTASSLSKPYIQIGIFSVEKNADDTATSMRQAGMTPVVHSQSANGRPFWRVVVGPASTSSERASLLRKVKELGFGDAYFVTN